MNDVEMHVRSVLSDLADGAPPSTGLVDAVHTRGRRARRRRLAVAAASVAVLGILAVVTIGLSGSGSTVQVAAPVTALPPAPVHLGALPAGFSEPRVTVYAREWHLVAVRANPGAELTVTILPAKPAGNDWPGSTPETLTLDGRPATLVTTPVNGDDSLASLTFERKSGQWIVVTVLSDGTGDPFAVISRDQLRAVATGLTDRPTPVAPLLRFGRVPDQLELCGSHDGSGLAVDKSLVMLCVTGGPDDVAVQLSWQRADGTWFRDRKHGTHRTPITVDGREGEVADAGAASGQLWYGWIRLTNGVVVNVETRAPNLFTHDEFVEFLGGLNPGPALK